MGKKASDIDPDKKQKRVLKYTRGGETLSEQQVQEIKEGRKKLKVSMKAQKAYNKKDFEVTASSLGLYFDKRKGLGFLWWLLGRKAFWALLGALLALLFLLFIMSVVGQMRGFFTINLSEGMFRNGFLLSETIGFENPEVQLFSDPAENVPCVSISSIPGDVDEVDGSNNSPSYFAYTFYLKNEGEDTVDYIYRLDINSESLDVSKAAWVMLFDENKMCFFAEIGEDGQPEAIPEKGDDSRGYPSLPLIEKSANPMEQYEVVGTRLNNDYYRVIPYPFESETVVTSGTKLGIMPGEKDKYTVVIWLEGDDPECTDDLIGGHMGLEMNFQLIAEEEKEEDDSISPWYKLKDLWQDMFNNLKF